MEAREIILVSQMLSAASNIYASLRKQIHDSQMTEGTQAPWKLPMEQKRKQKAKENVVTKPFQNSSSLPAHFNNKMHSALNQPYQLRCLRLL